MGRYGGPLAISTAVGPSSASAELVLQLGDGGEAVTSRSKKGRRDQAKVLALSTVIPLGRPNVRLVQLEPYAYRILMHVSRTECPDDQH